MRAAAYCSTDAARRDASTAVRPLPAGDPQGLVPFYVTLAATIMGFISMFQLRANAAPLSLRAWLVLIALLAAYPYESGLFASDSPDWGYVPGSFDELTQLAAEGSLSHEELDVVLAAIDTLAVAHE